MFKLYIFTAFLALAKCDDIDKFTGSWTPVKVYSEHETAPYECISVILEPTTAECKCGAYAKVPIVKATGPENRHRPNEIPMVSVNSESEVLAALSTVCTCNGVLTDSPLVIHYLSSNYFTSHAGFTDGSYTILFAKVVPSVREMDEFTETVAGLKGRRGIVLCSSDENSATRLSTKMASKKTAFFYEKNL